MQIKLNHEKVKVLVVGSSSLDLVLITPFRPQPGETVIATESEIFFGGKGANQAVCAARLGASAYLVSCVGQDPAGQQILRNLVEENVNVGFVYESEEEPTGTAYVSASQGKNSIIVVPAANFKLSKNQIRDAEKFFSTADIILLQLESPTKVVEYTAELAKKYGKRIGIYASPAKEISAEILDYASFLVIKEADIPIVFKSARKDELLTRFPQRLFVRDEVNGTEYFDGTDIKIIKDNRDIPHNTGLGDAFTAALAVSLCRGASVKEAVEFGREVAFHVGQKRGSQSALPYGDAFLQRMER